MRMRQPLGIISIMCAGLALATGSVSGCGLPPTRPSPASSTPSLISDPREQQPSQAALRIESFAVSGPSESQGRFLYRPSFTVREIGGSDGANIESLEFFDVDGRLVLTTENGERAERWRVVASGLWHFASSYDDIVSVRQRIDALSLIVHFVGDDERRGTAAATWTAPPG
jgi:hypothetical protein